MRAGEAITAEEAVRRVLILENPALRGQSADHAVALRRPAADPARRGGAQPPPHAERAALHRRRLRRLHRGRRRAHHHAAGRLHHHARAGPGTTTAARPTARWSGWTAWTSRWSASSTPASPRTTPASSQQVTRAEGTQLRALRPQHGAGAARRALRRHLADLQLPLRAQPRGAGAAGARRAGRRLGRRQAALREPAHRRLADAHHGDLHAEAAGRLRGQGLAPDRRRGLQRGRRRRRSGDRARRQAAGASPSAPRDHFVVPSWHTARFSSAARLRAVQFFRPPGAPGAGHPPAKKGCHELRLHPAAGAVACPSSAAPSASRCTASTAWAATTWSTPRRWASPAASRPSSSSSRPTPSCRWTPGETGTMPYPTPHQEPAPRDRAGGGHRHRRQNIKAADAQQAHLRLRRGPGHDAPRPAGRDEEAGPPLVHRQGLRPVGARSARSRRPRRPATSTTPRSGCRSTARTASAATCPS